jgi:hypothetical protein
MDLVKLYIVQSISAASNNLRLNSQQIEVVALLRETIVKAEDLQSELLKMKKITELSTLAIRLNEIHNFLTQGKVDFFKISELFRKDSQYLIRDLNRFLEQVSSEKFKRAIKKLRGEVSEDEIDAINVDLSKREGDAENLLIKESEAIKEELIMDEEYDSRSVYQDIEEVILKPVKTLDALLKKLEYSETNIGEVDNLTHVLESNIELLDDNGFEIISTMHKVLIKALSEIKTRKLMPGKDVVEAMRACLIVIVAVVKGKDVDITNYLNRAEKFGKKLSVINNQVTNR